MKVLTEVQSDLQYCTNVRVHNPHCLNIRTTTMHVGVHVHSTKFSKAQFVTIIAVTNHTVAASLQWLHFRAANELKTCIAKPHTLRNCSGYFITSSFSDLAKGILSCLETPQLALTLSRRNT